MLNTELLDRLDDIDQQLMHLQITMGFAIEALDALETQPDEYKYSTHLMAVLREVVENIRCSLDDAQGIVVQSAHP